MSAAADRPPPDKPKGSARRESTPRTRGLGARTPKIVVQAPDFVPLDREREQAAITALVELLAAWLAKQETLRHQTSDHDGGQARAA
jgi:hypothetical protein